MKIIVSTLIFLAVFNLINFAQDDDQMKSVEKIISDIKEQYVPDNRIAIYNISSGIKNGKIFVTGELNSLEIKEELINRLNELKIDYRNEVELLPSAKLGDKIFGVVILSVANLRSKPDHNEELSTQALLGTPIKIYKKGEEGFFLVQTPDGYISWMDDDGFQIMNENEMTEWLKSEKIIYINEYGFSYSQKDENSQRVSDLTAGNILRLINEEDDYYKVLYPDNREAFIKKEEAKLFNNWYSSLNPNGEQILQTAYRFMGIPYLWGGTSAKGMDCSGFTKTVYFLNGIVLPRDASQQVNIGKPVESTNGWKDFLPGDLLFFGSKATDKKKERITHVAIYIGDGDFIHAAGRVRINSFNENKPYFSKFRSNGFIRSKRILNSIGENGVQMIEQNSFYRK
ncbi:MAG: C40 family peptidase [Ignavibacteriaceae bacterium]|nr:C40 family peptidase [Ignavibacteriaceae bacterium]